MRKITSFLLFFSLLGSFVPVSVSAEELVSDDFLENLSPELAEEKGLLLDPSPEEPQEESLPEEITTEETEFDAITTSASSSSGEEVLPPKNINPDAVKSFTAFSGKEKVNEFTGDMGYEYSFFLPSSGNGFPPSLSIDYSSSRKNISSLVGYGWELSLPKIERFSKTGVENIYTANNFTSPFASGNGELSEKNIDENGYGEYIPKVISGKYKHEFLEDQSWKVIDAKGTTYFFGTTENERIQNEDGSRIHSWFLSKVQDTNGNIIHYEYKKNQGSLLPSRILYGKEEHPFEVRFEPYFSEENTSFDVFPSYARGFPMIEKQDPLTQIEIRSPFSAEEIHYVFSYYEQSDDYDFQMTHYLKGIQKKGTLNGEEIAESPVLFSYAQYDGENSIPTPHPNEILQTRTTDERLLWDMADWKKVPRWIYGDYNGDGWTDLVKNIVYTKKISGSYNYFREEEAYLNNGNGEWTHFIAETPKFRHWARQSFYNSVTEYFAYPSFLDMNGDGISDLCIKNIRLTRKNTTYCSLENYAFGDRIMDGVLLDVNGDGLNDVANILKQGRDRGRDTVSINDTNGLSQSEKWTITLYKYRDSDPSGNFYLEKGNTTGDINGDGLDDFILFHEINASREKCIKNEKKYKKILLSSGDGWIDVTSSITIPRPILEERLSYNCSNPKEEGKSELRDVNRDGLPDLFFGNGKAYLNNGKGWDKTITQISWMNPAEQDQYTQYHHEYRISDFNKDGIFERTAIRRGDDLYTYFFEKDSKEMPLLSNVQIPTGGSIDVEYTPASAYKNPDGSAANFDLPIPHLTVSGITLRDGIGTESTTHYSYSDGKLYHPRVPGGVRKQQFLGFGKVEKTLFDGSKILTEYAQGDTANFFSTKGLVKNERVFEKNGKILTETRNIFSVLERIPTKSFEALLEKSVSLFFDPQDSSQKKATAFSFDYDSFGNPTHETDFGEVRLTDDAGNFEDIGTDRIDTETEYSINETAHILSLPKEITRKDQDENILGHQKILYDNLPFGEVEKGNPTDQKSLVSTEGQWISQKTEYNNLGQPTKIINPRGFSTEIQYDSESLFPTTVRNAKGHETLLEYHPLFGIPQKVTNANGAVQKISFDALGRPSLLQKNHPTTGALVSAERYAYDEAHFPMSIFREQYLGHSNIAVESREYFDGFGRPIQSFVEAEGKMDGQQKFAVTSTIYDELGRISKSIFPKFVGGNAFFSPDSSDFGAEFSYDALGRILSTKTPVGENQTEYGIWTERHTDANGKKKDFAFDARGNLIAVTEWLGEESFVTAYNYNGNGNLLRITDALGNLQKNTYDLLGKKITSTLFFRPDTANPPEWNFAYDANGNQISSEDPSGNAIFTTYDELDRPLTQTATAPDNSEEKIIFSYDATPHGIGLPAEVISPNIKKSFSYDFLGNVSEEIRTLFPEDRSFIFSSEYDLLGNLLKIASPDLITRYAYNTAGQLEGIFVCQGSGEESCVLSTLVSNIDTNEAGAVIRKEYGNGVTTEDTFDRSTGFRLTHRQTLAPEKDGVRKILQDLSYSFDSVGNITEIEDESETSLAKTNHYEYDDLHRLTRAIITPEEGTPEVFSYTYDILGNMLSNSSLGEYDYNSIHPHAVTQVTPLSPAQLPLSFSYDTMGNMISGRGISQNWDSRGRLAQSSFSDSNRNSSVSLLYSYDEGRTRIKKQSCASSFEGNLEDCSETLSPHDLLDIEIDETGEEIWKSFVFLGSERIAVFDDSNSSSCSAPPKTGDWILAEDCVLSRDVLVPENLIVRGNAIMTIEGESTLYLDLKQFHVLVEEGSGILIKKGSTLRQGTAETAVLSAEEETVSEEASENPEEVDFSNLSSLLSAGEFFEEKSAENSSLITPFALSLEGSFGNTALTTSLVPRDVVNEEEPFSEKSASFSLADFRASSSDPSEVLKTFVEAFETKESLNGKIAGGRVGILPFSSLEEAEEEILLDSDEKLPIEGGGEQEAKKAETSISPKNGEKTEESFSFFDLPVPQELSSSVAEIGDPLPNTPPASSFHFFSADHLGSVSTETDGEGEVFTLSDYFPYGEIRTEESFYVAEFPNDYGYTGKERDRETELLYYEARYYDPVVGRFVSTDPWSGELTDPQSLNKYAYTRNNPVKYVDPSGEKTEIVGRLANQSSGFFDRSNKTDFGHVLININETYYGWVPRGELIGESGYMTKKSEIGQMLSPNYKDAEFMFFEMNITDSDENILQRKLEEMHTASDYKMTGEYNLFNQNCVTEGLKILENTTNLGLKGATSATTPANLIENLWGKYLVGNSSIKNVEGGYTQGSQLTRVPNLPKHSSSFFGLIKRENSIYNLRSKIIDSREKSKKQSSK